MAATWARAPTTSASNRASTPLGSVASTVGAALGPVVLGGPVGPADGLRLGATVVGCTDAHILTEDSSVWGHTEDVLGEARGYIVHSTLLGDDGTSLDYLEGDSAQTLIKWDDASKTLSLEPASKQTATRAFQVELMPNGKTKVIQYDGRPLELKF